MNHGVYKIRNLNNGKLYIGSAAKYSFKTRWAKHQRDLKRKDHHSIKLQRAWNKYGANAFVFEVLLYCDPKHCLMYEQIALDHFKPEYNISPTAGSCLGSRWTKEQKRAFSISKKGQRFSNRHKKALSENHADVSGKNNPFFGKSHTKEVIDKIRSTCRKRSIENIHKHAKLTEADVLAIRKRYIDGDRIMLLSHDFNVTRKTIYEIVNRKTWSHV